jgi:hypothetical protein
VHHIGVDPAQQAADVEKIKRLVETLQAGLSNLGLGAPLAPPANPVSADPAPAGAGRESTAGPKKRSRKRTRKVGPQTLRARKVLYKRYPGGSYPSEEEVTTCDLLKDFEEDYNAMCKSRDLPRTRYGKPSDTTVLREVGRKD